MEIKIDERVFNPVYLGALFDESPYLHLWGGTGSGKSKFAAQKNIFRMLHDTGFHLLVIRKVQRTIRRSAFRELCKVISEWGLSEYFTILKGRMEIYSNLNDNWIICEGLDDPEKLKSISDITSVWIEEPTELTIEEFTEVDRRLRGFATCYKQILLSYNPINYYHWINQRIHIGGLHRDRTRLIHTTHNDNLFLDSSDRRKIDEQFRVSQTQGKIYAEGLWSIPEHVIYSNFSTGSEWIEGLEIAYGVDFGINNQTAVLRGGWHDRFKVTIDERMYESGVTNSELIEFLKSDIPHPSTPIYCDSAEKNRIVEMQRAGLNATGSDKAVSPGIDYVRRHDILITRNSPNVEREIQLYEFRKQGDVVTDQPIKINDHAMDAMRYLLYTHGMKFISHRFADKSTTGLPNVPKRDTSGVIGSGNGYDPAANRYRRRSRWQQ